MKQTDFTSMDFLIMWQNRFPNLACILAPYARVLIAQSLQLESCFILRVAYFITRLRNLEEFYDQAQQMDWLLPESREELINDLVVLEMDALVKHLRESSFAVIPDNIIWSVINSLDTKLNDYFCNHRMILINDLESATGQTVNQLPARISLSLNSSDVIEHLSLPYVLKFLTLIENADHELAALKELLLTSHDPVDPIVKRRFLDFRIDLDRHLKSFQMQIPEIAEEWLYNVFELFEAYPNYFGK